MSAVLCVAARRETQQEGRRWIYMHQKNVHLYRTTVVQEDEESRFMVVWM